MGIHTLSSTQNIKEHHKHNERKRSDTRTYIMCSGTKLSNRQTVSEVRREVTMGVGKRGLLAADNGLHPGPVAGYKDVLTQVSHPELLT